MVAIGPISRESNQARISSALGRCEDIILVKPDRLSMQFHLVIQTNMAPDIQVGKVF